MPKKSLLDSIDVPAPCPKKWDEMTGDDKTRFCGSCEKNIYNISAMTAKEARKLLFQSKEKLCIRIERDSDGKIQTLKNQFHKITRQAPIAAGVLSVSLTFSALTYAQVEPVVGRTRTNVSAKNKEEQTRVSISGTITDENGAIVPGAVIFLRNIKDDSARSETSNGEGFYEFKDVARAIYRIEIERSGFKKFIYENIKIDGDKNLQLAIVLYANEPFDHHPVHQEMKVQTLETQSVRDEIETRKFEPLPARKNLPLLGLFPGVNPKPQKKASDKKQNATSHISFTVYDVTGAIVPNQQIKLKNQKTKEEFVTLTDSQGVARFYSIPRGKYDLEITGNGFSPYERSIRIKEQIEPNVKITVNSFSAVGDFIFDWSEIPMFRAIAQDDNETVRQMIVNANFNVDTKDESGQTALHVAVQHQNLEIVRFLLEKGAKVNVKDKQKREPLAMVFESFGEDDEEATREIFRLLVSKGADINFRNSDKETLLMNACLEDNLEGVKFLLELGADPNLKDNLGETAMQKTDSEEIKQLLKRYGARE
jgi:hypothetical protein